MSKIRENILKIVNKIFKENNIKMLPLSQSEKVLREYMDNGIIRDFERCINEGINIKELDVFYGEKLGNKKGIYNIPLDTKLSKTQTLELAKQFFSTLDVEAKNLDELNCPIRGDLRDLYEVVNEFSHTLVLKNDDIEARKIYGEVVPECVERMLDEYLLNLNNEYMQKYGFNKSTLIQDVRKKQISNFLSKKDNIMAFNNKTGNPQTNLRNILALIYSSAFINLPQNSKKFALKEFIKDVENNEIDSCSNSFGINIDNKLKTQLLMLGIVNDVKNTHNQIVMQEELQNILEKSKIGNNFVEKINGQHIHINLESKIPFILVTPSTLKDGQTLVMESNNLETNNTQKLLQQALGTAKDLNEMLKGSNPILIPILPSEGYDAPYYQQLSVECFQDGKRPDLDVLDAINSAKEIMKKQYGIKLNDKIFLNGYSSSGCFAQRFSLIHPEIVDTACIGGASGSIPIPSNDLEYPLGIKNYEKLFGKKFDKKEYKKITFDYYVGSLECESKAINRTNENGNLAPKHDMSYFDKSVPKDIGEKYRKKFGQDMFERANNIITYLKNSGINISNTIIPNVAHNDKEASELKKKSSSFKNSVGIRSYQKQIVLSSINKMKQRHINKENIYLRSK